MLGARAQTADWIFMDIGNVLWSDDAGDAFTRDNIASELAREGVDASPEELEASTGRAIAAYAPSVWRAVIWNFVAGDPARYERIADRVYQAWCDLDDARYRDFTRPFDGVGDMLAELRGSGYRLGLASNNSARALERLEDLGLLQHFEQRDVSETLGLAKPDARFFVHLLEKACCPASRAVMVGDRLCNDIAPARMLGMKTLRVLKGWHREQRARSPRDLPDRDVAEPGEIPAALASLDA